MLLMRPCILTPTHVTTNGKCVRSHFLWQVGRGGQRGAMTLRCLLSEITFVMLMRVHTRLALHAQGSFRLSAVSFMCHFVQLSG